ncbi:MAG: lipopolysaccharide kinase InaA family protein [Planctomycetia bacterium]
MSPAPARPGPAGAGRDGPPEGALEGPLAAAARAEGVGSVADVLDRAEYVRDLPQRSNHVLRLAGCVLHVKRAKPRGFLRRVPREDPEARGLARLAAAGIPCAQALLWGRDRRLGTLVATADLAPARPLDALLAEGWSPPGGPGALAGALAGLAARLHDAGLHHRDLYLNHLYADPAAGAGALRLVLIDAERVGRHRARLGRRVRKDLACLLASGPAAWWEPARAAQLVENYLAGRRLPAGLGARLLPRLLRKAARIRGRTPRTPVGEAARPRPGGTP